MSESDSSKSFISGLCNDIAGIRKFSHAAMATTFEIFTVHEDNLYAQQAAQAAFDEADRLEKEFSRFIENSDISQIGNLTAHETLRLGLDSFRCLSLCAKVCRETGGAFDVTVGALMNCWFDKDRNLRHPSKEELESARRRTGCGIFKLDEEQISIEVMADRIQIDLGAVGKGYAVDKIGESLRDWDVATALISGGDSSVLALDGPEKLRGWPVALSGPDNRVLAKLYLRNRSVSGSGIQRRKHIINPHTGQPVVDKLAAWSCAADAATADALSTAFMVMKQQDIEQYCLHHADSGAMILPAGNKKPVLYGNWQGLFGDSAPDGV